jgi:hypothetical protein
MLDASGQFQRSPRSGGDLRTVLRPDHVVDLDAVTLLCAWHAAFSMEDNWSRWWISARSTRTEAGR